MPALLSHFERGGVPPIQILTVEHPLAGKMPVLPDLSLGQEFACSCRLCEGVSERHVKRRPIQAEPGHKQS